MRALSDKPDMKRMSEESLRVAILRTLALAPTSSVDVLNRTVLIQKDVEILVSLRYSLKYID